MRIVTFTKISEFAKEHPDSETALKEWFKRTKNAKWTCFADVKNTFNTMDSVGNNRFVFNIRGNTYRLVAIIIFASAKVYIRFIGSHAEYDKINCSKI
jgi:mRNA interferase HigB